ncbi:MAG: HIT family protein [Aestuariivirgaceae bacterium]|nr:HIT family protein [Aestuariivirgaceae bacterium]
MPNATALKFGHPATWIAEYAHWQVLLRPAQVTLGSLVLVCKDEADSFSRISPEAFAELGPVTADLEAALSRFNPCERLNWLMLMMVDRDVHFHVIPRYSAPQTFADTEFPDPAWPGPPDLARAVKPDPELLQKLTTALKAHWPQAAH